MNVKSETKKIKLFIISFLSILFFIANTAQAQDFTLSSPAFKDNGVYPKLYTCDSAALSPPLTFQNIPKGTKSLAISMHHVAKDGDKHVYLMLYNIPVNETQIRENSKSIGLFGHNTMNKDLAYSPPCSKGPGEKAYIITAYAISTDIQEKALIMDDFLKIVKDKVLATSGLTVKYTR